MTNLNMFNVLLQNKNKKNKPTRIGRTGTWTTYGMCERPPWHRHVGHTCQWAIWKHSQRIRIVFTLTPTCGTHTPVGHLNWAHMSYGPWSCCPHMSYGPCWCWPHMSLGTVGVGSDKELYAFTCVDIS
jgi:hypothetical protein